MNSYSKFLRSFRFTVAKFCKKVVTAEESGSDRGFPVLGTFFLVNFVAAEELGSMDRDFPVLGTFLLCKSG